MPCRHACYRKPFADWCDACTDEAYDDHLEAQKLDALCAADPARTRGHEYATEAEWREHLDETTGPERRAA